MSESRLDYKLVLVVDDDAESRLLLTEYLETLGCRVITARSGQEGLYSALAYQPDLVVLDVHLPDMTGWEILAEIRKEPRTAHLRTVVVSGASDLGDQALVEGLDAVAKPVDPLALFDAVRRNIRESQGRILVVDDNEEDRTLIAGFLEPHVAEVITAADGAEAVEILRKREVDLILLDLMMPRMDGFRFLALLRNTPRFQKTPVLVISGKRLSAEEVAYLKKEAEGVVGKDGQLDSAIRRSLHRIVVEGD